MSENRKFETGSVRDSVEGKGDFYSIPPHALKRLALRFEFGAKKYDRFNWRKGQPMSVLMDSLERHLNDFKSGCDKEDHLAAIAWNVFVLMDQERRLKAKELPASLDDLQHGATKPDPNRFEYRGFDCVVRGSQEESYWARASYRGTKGLKTDTYECRDHAVQAIMNLIDSELKLRPITL